MIRVSAGGSSSLILSSSRRHGCRSTRKDLIRAVLFSIVVASLSGPLSPIHRLTVVVTFTATNCCKCCQRNETDEHRGLNKSASIFPYSMTISRGPRHKRYDEQLHAHRAYFVEASEFSFLRSISCYTASLYSIVLYSVILSYDTLYYSTSHCIMHGLMPKQIVAKPYKSKV